MSCCIRLNNTSIVPHIVFISNTQCPPVNRINTAYISSQSQTIFDHHLILKRVIIYMCGRKKIFWPLLYKNLFQDFKFVENKYSGQTNSAAGRVLLSVLSVWICVRRKITWQQVALFHKMCQKWSSYDQCFVWICIKLTSNYGNWLHNIKVDL